MPKTDHNTPALFRGGGALPALLLLLFMSLGFQANGSTQPDEEEIERAVIVIEVTRQRGDWYSPWQRARSSGSSGSGFIIDKGLVITNAHVVSDAKQIIVKRNGKSIPYFAEVAHIAHDSDLALLRIPDPRFMDKVRPLRIGDLPSLRTRVRTYGFPLGGEKLSRTEGVVSRVEFVTYAHSGADAHLAIQTDSAINPGNSGGPVLQNGKVVGVAFQASTHLNDVGFFIPTPVLKRFLKDIADSRYDGYAELGLVTTNLINPSYRRYLGLPAGVSGVVVERVLRGTSAEGRIFPGDVIAAIEGNPLRFDGTITYFGHSLNFEQIAEEKQVGQSLRLRVWRKGKLREIKIVLKPFREGKRLRSAFDTLPAYVVYAGLVFMKLNQEYLKIFGNYWRDANKFLLYHHFYRRDEQIVPPARETVLLTRILPHKINSTYRGWANTVVSHINGQAIYSLAQVPPAFAAVKGRYHRIRLEDSGVVLVLDRHQAEASQQEIMATYGIPAAERLP